MPNLGQILQKALKDANVSPADAADYIGISEGNLYRLFKKDTFEVAYLKKVADLLKLPIAYFFQESGVANLPEADKLLGSSSQTGNSITPKVKVSKAPAHELAQQLDACQREVESLKRELALASALVAAKDETITLLRASYNRPH